jgi:hypothetical protein
MGWNVQVLANAVLATARSPAFSAALNADVPQRRFAVQLLCHLELLEHVGRGVGLMARPIDRRTLCATDRSLASVVDAAGRTSPQNHASFHTLRKLAMPAPFCSAVTRLLC